ncbi:PASTA domain-containing protein [Streptomyces cyaneochromogenes]|uniref:PASTA domain-containing protein n=1 Tax=Streptomyces cyaneochromogenes TaxID=2496836 RepID=A0A3S9MG19_9ACTN|nr:PASTA domain-containing protein [Streptomyces cyaneochromogenes]AZQ38103.1 PASTA domain-containing protein [Streptomyces cyaneochromogenes]
MNPYNTPAPAPSRPWWRTTPAALGVLALVALLGAFSFAVGFLVMIAAMVAVWMLPPWRWFARLGATFGALVLLTVGAGLGGQLDDSGTGKSDAKSAGGGGASAEAVSASPTASKSKPAKAADYVGKRLDEAEKQARSAGYTAGHHDAADEDRAIILRSGWTVCFQKADTAAKTIDFAAVKSAEPCPAKDGGPLPWPKMPDVVGATYNKAVKDLKKAGIGLDRVTLDDVYLDVDTPTAEEAAEDGDEWRVCFQSPDEGTEVESVTRVRLDLGRWTDADLVQHCPSAKDTTYKIPANDPDYNNEDDNSTTGGGGSTGGGSSSSSGGGTSVGTVHPGSFCSPAGATGVTAAGTPMVCGPGSDGRNRWHSA